MAEEEGLTIIRHGQNRNLCDGTISSLNTSCALVDSGQVRVHVTRITTTTGHFFAAPNSLLRRTWPWEDYVLIDSRVETTLPETDLFTGLR